jgi:hypothetical protein
LPKYRIVAFLIVIAVVPAFTVNSMAEQDFAATVYGGRMTDGDFGEALTGNAEFIDAYVMVGALSWTFARFYDDALSFELEGQVGKWFGDSDHLEFNLPVAIRWSKFPWNHYVATSLAYGLGPSYATEEPEAEIDVHGTTHQFLIYWFAELALGPPESSWAGVLRIHHRSGAFGLVSDRGDGGSNTLCIGIKYRF